MNQMVLLIGGGSKNDAIDQAEKQDAINGVPVPSLAETKAIAQEGFVFGLPIVMYYTSAYELYLWIQLPPNTRRPSDNLPTKSINP
jgi:hypothetical protein